ncbi:flagellin [Breoghania sp. L-A4]|uniref:flagellin N-terminal helical domain-containing protein n=1 Tax=Breoghania sp. L-A4 TaxID=2304600 RepID=UPI000E360999|nr:flagellin [Breoghania sp. L-A4]AXS41218.1 flagellar protein [Breoghania sp. L-A4]
MSDITLSAGVRQNLLSLQNTADLMATTQNRLATGKKVNSALDNPTNFFTASSLQSRSNDLSQLMDGMSNGIKTLEAADNGLTSITKTLESMKSTLSQARQDKSFETSSFTIDSATIGTATAETLSISGGAVGTTPVDVALNTADVAATAATLTGAGGTDLSVADPDLSALAGETLTLSDGTNTVAYTFTGSATGQKAALESALSASGFTTAGTAGGLDVSRADGANVTVTTTNASVDAVIGLANNDVSVDGVAGTTGTVKTVDELVTAINADSSLAGAVRASNDNGKLRIENQSTQDLTLTGTGTGGIDGSAGTSTIDGNSVRADLSTQFNELRDQLDKLSDDASFNGINLLRGDNLKLTFNETSTSTIDIQTKNGETVNSATLGINDIDAVDLDSDANIDSLVSGVKEALNSVRSQSSAFGSNLSIVENRQDFTKMMMNTLQTGADNLVLADGNEEAANMLALQTRQQLSSTALSLASQADQAPLRLF